MIEAAKEGDVALLKKRFEEGNNPSIRDEDGMTPLHYAIECGNLACVNYLLRPCMAKYKLTRVVSRMMHETDGKDGIIQIRKRMPLEYACHIQAHIEIIQALVAADPEAAGLAVFEVVFSNDRVDVLKLILNAVRPNVRKNPINRALHIAARKGSQECMKLLLRAGADTSWLCEEKGDLNSKKNCKQHNTKIGHTALHLAVINNHRSCTQILLSFMSADDINITNIIAKPVLCIAAEKDNKEMIKILLAGGADPHIHDVSEILPVEHACTLECAELLLGAMDRKYVFPIQRYGLSIPNIPIWIIKLVCGTYPELYAPRIFDIMLHKWESSKDDCISIIQLFLSQISLNHVFNNRHSKLIYISHKKLATDFKEILDTFALYGQDFIVCLESAWSQTSAPESLFYLPHAMTIRLCMHYNGDYSVEIFPILRTLLSINPAFTPKMIVDILDDYNIIGINMANVPSSWELRDNDLSDALLRTSYDLEEGSYSLKHLARSQFRKSLQDRGLVSYGDFTKSLSELPACVQNYIRYLGD